MKFSIVIPVYNVEQYLKNCVDSVLSQTFTDFELILVDDGSTDNSPLICDEYAKNDARVRVVHKVNGGQSSARNIGVSKAVGEYIVFLDSDDFICKNDFLEKLNKADQTDVIIYRYSKYYSDDKISPLNLSYSDLPKDKTEFLRKLVNIDGFFCSCWTKAIKRDVIAENSIAFDESLNCEDIDWYYNVVLKAHTFSAIDEVFVMYRQRQGSVTKAMPKKSCEGLIYTINKWKDNFDRLTDESLKNVMLSSLAKIYCNLLISYSKSTKMLKEYKSQILSNKGLLKYDSNPRVRKFAKISKIVGVRGLIFALTIIGKLK